MSDVPDEICREILLKLPVRPLLRCRCVLKSWKCMIDSDQFIKHHLDHSKKKSNRTRLTIIANGDSLDAANFDLLIQTNRATFKLLRPPFFHRSKPRLNHPDPEILGSCDGLLALKYKEDGKTIVWNPSIRRFHKVPRTRIGIGIGICLWFDPKFVYGFGYDAVSNDYKLVRMVMYFKGLTAVSEWSVNIYSLKSNSWRIKPNFPYSLQYSMLDDIVHGVFVDGASHWIVIRKDTDAPGGILLLAAYDLGTEEVRLVPLPEIAGNYDKVLASLGGCLCLVYNDRNDRHHEVWVMKEYGVEESWSILFTVLFYDSPLYMRPLAYSRCGRKVLLTISYKLVWYDLDTKSTYSPMVQAPSHYLPYTMSTCLQSLVLLNSGTCDSDLFTKKKQRKGNKTSSTPRKDCLTNNRTGVLPAKGRPPWR